VNGLLWILVGLIGLTVLLRILAWLVHVPLAAEVFGRMPWLPIGHYRPLADGEAVEFTAEDGAHLRGTYLSSLAARRKGVLAFCHELNGDRWSAVLYVQELRRRGFDVLTFDFRNHGSSDHVPGYEPMPWVTTHELLDVRAAIDYLCAFRGAETIGLLGVSRGGTAALCAAAGDPRVRAVVIDGVVPTERMQLYGTRRWLKNYLVPAKILKLLPDRLLGVLGAWAKTVIGRKCGYRFVNVDRAATRASQPVLMIHGQHESYVPVEVARALRSMMGALGKLWVVARAGQCRAAQAAPAEFHRHVARFFQRHLAVRSHREPAVKRHAGKRRAGPQELAVAGASRKPRLPR
jgi:uncharacterized protein